MEVSGVDVGLEKTRRFATKFFRDRSPSASAWQLRSTSHEIGRCSGKLGMATSKTILSAHVAAGALVSLALSQTSEPPEGRVTIIYHDVQLLPSQADARPAAIDDKIDEDTSLRTGNDSRSELAFTDLTLTRLGSNTIFSVNKAGRSVHLDA